jgi:hypothetical protein
MSSWPPAHIVSKTFFAIVGDMAGAGRRPVPLAQKFRKPFLALEHARARGFAVAPVPRLTLCLPCVLPPAKKRYGVDSNLSA